jgi:uncharacterized coiled-coil DUF342 family protein
MKVTTPNSSTSAERMDSSQDFDANIAEFEVLPNTNEDVISHKINYLMQKVQELEQKRAQSRGHQEETAPETNVTSSQLLSRVYKGLVALALIIALTANWGWSKNEELNKLKLKLKHVTDERDAMKLQIFDLQLAVCPARDELDTIKLKYEDLFQAICVKRDDYHYRSNTDNNLKTCFDYLNRARKNYAAVE